MEWTHGVMREAQNGILGNNVHDRYLVPLFNTLPSRVFDRKRKHNVINHITMFKHHSKYCFVLDLKYICVLILLEREL